MEGATGCSVVAEGCEVCCGITRRKSNLEGERRSETGGGSAQDCEDTHVGRRNGCVGRQCRTGDAVF